MNEIINLLKGLFGDIKEIKKKQYANKGETKILQEKTRKLRNKQTEFREEMKQLKDINRKAVQVFDRLKKEGVT